MKKLVPVISMLCVVLFSCNEKKPLFRSLKSEQTGILFSNTITEDNELNPLTYEYLYNGGGVGIGNFNNDSLPDIYFTGNMVSNKLYINKGGLRFEDATTAAGVGGGGKWCKGASVVDINNDGLDDIYVCAAVATDSFKRKNMLYVNQGADKKTGIPVFKEMAAAYGLDDNSHTQMAAFFDYDNDGDLDVYLLVNDLIDGVYPNEFRPVRTDGSWPNTDKLFRNDWNDSLHHAVFTNVSAKAGILTEGYGLGISITDINKDGWKDIYITNDYLSNNILYINNHNGTFSNQCAAYFKHSSKNAMGNDVADINNDGLDDIIELDMAPAGNYRQKMMMNDMSYQTYQNFDRFGYMYQYARNTLQLNLGMAPESSRPLFAEIAYYSGVAHTDWSWAPLLVDADNDGYRDLMITNGLPKDMSDLDFIAYRNNTAANTPLPVLLEQIPTVQISNYIYKNNGDLTFSDQTKEWGWEAPGFATGMAYADLDRDGDMDVVINNTNATASVMENTSAKKNYLQVILQGDSMNRNAAGALVSIYCKGQQQVYEYSPYRGYISSVEHMAHFGIGENKTVDSLIITWPGGQQQLLTNVNANQTLEVKKEASAMVKNIAGMQAPLFSNCNNTTGISYTAAEVDFIDFNIQKLLPHKLTQYGPSLAVADVTGDGLDDIVAGGGSPTYAALFVQQKDGRYIKQHLIDSTASMKYQDDGGICLFDADNDGDADMYIASGGCENGPGYESYADRFYINDGKGHFKENKEVLTPNYTAKSCVKAADYDNDGDLDLFVGGRVFPGSYPKPVSSILLRNDTQNGVVKFTNATASSAPALQNTGLVTDAVWTDVDNDGFTDLIIAGEWMPLTVLKNEQGKLIKTETALSKTSGWWNSIAASDIDNDGDMDYIAGNFGSNGYLNPSAEFPLKIYGKDFDNNGSFDAVLTHFYPQHPGDAPAEYPVAGRDDFIKEMTVMKGKFPNYALYANATLQQIFDNAALADAVQSAASLFITCWIENKGNMNFEMHPLPAAAQWAPVYGIAAGDFTGDGNIDLVLNGNEYSMSPMLGRYDAMNGLLLQGDGNGNFKTLLPAVSGIYVPGNGKAIAALVINNTLAMAASQNKGPLLLFRSAVAGNKITPVMADDRYALLHLENGKTRKEEFSYGSSFMSQSGRYICFTKNVLSADIYNAKKERRTINNK
ncbi:MAG: VCBS repeat-containing protein [Ferruginibacter sp.]